jgi:short-subunit dehydrogenase
VSYFSGKHILVVGASGAFGAEFSRQLIALGAEVSGTARNADSSVRLPGELNHRLLLDLESSDSITNFAAYLNSLTTPLDGIVLASGLVAFGSFTETPGEVTERLMRVNALGQLQLVKEMTPKLVTSAQLGRDPFVLSISGVISENPMPGLASYSASKTALHGFSLSAGKELKKLGVSWVDARPGHTESGLAGRAIFGTAPNFGTGKDVSNVVSRMLIGLANQEKDLPSSAF